MDARSTITLVVVTCATASMACGGGGGQGDDDSQGPGITNLDTGASTATGASTGTGTGVVTGGGSSTSTTDDGLDGTTDGLRFDLPTVVDLSPGDDECAAVTVEGELVPAPADVVFVVDNSGSMGFEAMQIQAEMNGFSGQIIASGIDVHVVLISSYPGVGNGICIPPPLGGGGCPLNDDAPPVFTHVDRQVNSHDAWQALLQTHGQWGPAWREDSSKHIVVVTDDTSSMDWTDFDDDFTDLDPSYADYIHHSVVCHSNCPDAAGIGTDYIQLSMVTGGVASDLCAQDFQTVFDVLSTEVIGGAQLACEFEIPPPPGDLEFDPDEVNVEFDDGLGNVLPIGKVDSAADCPNVTDGWYYDDPTTPQHIVVCPQTCDKLQDAEDGTVNIAFGCASVPAG
ncbi:hypothetical protein [Paraliomyxa miuraensis]|uniref:hypothetical protein n=1 Tax=Paraliomyxa miuraensis TaxID=376150 RepID=UPI00224E169D|nr:hypothetical protein [Paraliomyxa miuraensis]MCX4243354.1 hypothetical protein [Paraliomyxa miuraensis]